MRIYHKVILTFVLILSISFVLPAMALPPEMEADRLLLSVAKHLGSPEATAEFKKILELNIKLPTDYYYYYGKHLFEIGMLKEAKENIEKYLEKAGREGQFYNNSLQLFSAIEKDQSKLSRFIVHGDDTLTDKKTGLMWAVNDNGGDIDWKNAYSYCQNYTGGGYTDWRLPTQDELVSLYDREGDNKYGLRITRLFNLTHSVFWASENRGSEAAAFTFSEGRRVWMIKTLTGAFRALPVRGGTQIE